MNDDDTKAPSHAFDNWRLKRQPPPPECLEMFKPARCTFCGDYYDLATVTVIARFADCSVWTTPCCGKTADDNPLKRAFGGRGDFAEAQT